MVLGAGEGSVQADVVARVHGHLASTGNQTGDQGQGGEEGRKRFHEVLFLDIGFCCFESLPRWVWRSKESDSQAVHWSSPKAVRRCYAGC